MLTSRFQQQADVSRPDLRNVLNTQWLPVAMELFWQIMEAVEYIHSRNVCHMDLDPNNIMIADGNTVKLIDFGSG